MAKKVSKHSRAARRLEVDEPEAKELSQLPRPENTDLTNKLIRTANKNEELLNRKLEKKKKHKIGKNVQNNSNRLDKALSAIERNLEKERLERGLNFGNRLDGKIAKSISRAKYVQTSRKAGWDVTNLRIKEELSQLQHQTSDQVGKNPLNQKEEDSTEFDEDFETFGDAEKKKKMEKQQKNSFVSLETDVEA
ncbi:related to Shuttling pre-60S factor ECM1 [Saccharomycodes ludwigii]|uniref:Related to Shuttling pre-60S factor ECM1 n=1 Tax=Saccharomycodes ludwigii TaxID=36035 RepID=A0A376B3R2_9ASCO|nr:hypothetical protein SCDLUD_004958 [Saccharomycodes ludwigii]KAH3899513.1 hypothetical protein SCDLUD_004958 [Saccharomycodes ludwigii]SSD59229.1 related to Shuttling pre-60S factor ECM1 [Saccharomycodes ludwigii]